MRVEVREEGGAGGREGGWRHEEREGVRELGSKGGREGEREGGRKGERERERESGHNLSPRRVRI